LIDEDISEMIDSLEVTLGMGLYVLTSLLETVREQISSSGSAIGYAGYSAGWNNSVFENRNGVRHQHGYMEERNVVDMGTKL
jgi:hypothetical protein